MAFTVRKDERDRVAAILESGEYETAAEMAAAVERFWSKVEKTDDCWLWTAAKDPNGYGRFGIDRAVRLAHRVSLAWATGMDLGTDLCALHSCDNPSCVRPAHLRWGTQKDNVQDAISRGRANLSGSEVRTHCYKGHRLTPDNVYVRRRSGDRRCRICTLETNRKWKESRRAVHAES